MKKYYKICFSATQGAFKNQDLRYIVYFCFSAFLLLPGCNSKKNHTLNTKINEIVAVDSLFEPTGDAELDSMILLTVNAPVDTNLAQLYSDIGYYYYGKDSEKAKEWLLKQKTLSEYLNWNKG